MEKDNIILIIGIAAVIISCIAASIILSIEKPLEPLNIDTSEVIEITNDTLNETLNQTSNETAEEIPKKETPKKEKQDPNKYYDPKTGRIHTIEDGLDYVLSPGDPGYDKEIKKYR